MKEGAAIPLCYPRCLCLFVLHCLSPVLFASEIDCFPLPLFDSSFAIFFVRRLSPIPHRLSHILAPSFLPGCPPSRLSYPLCYRPRQVTVPRTAGYMARTKTAGQATFPGHSSVRSGHHQQRASSLSAASNTPDYASSQEGGVAWSCNTFEQSVSLFNGRAGCTCA